MTGTQRLSDEQMRSLPADFLADELRIRVAQATAAFDRMLIFPQAGDNLNDPTTTWPDAWP
jgi:catalase